MRVLSSLFRRLFLEALDAAFRAGELSFHAKPVELAEPARFAQLLDAARGVTWVVNTNSPFGGPDQVFGDLGRYTHRVAISNSRLVRIEDGSVAFRWKDYRHHDRQKVMTLEADEFLRRFLLHVLPDGFQRIGHDGLLRQPGPGGPACPVPPAPGGAPTADAGAGLDLADPRYCYEALRTLPVRCIGARSAIPDIWSGSASDRQLRPHPCLAGRYVMTGPASPLRQTRTCCRHRRRPARRRTGPPAATRGQPPGTVRHPASLRPRYFSSRPTNPAQTGLAPVGQSVRLALAITIGGILLSNPHSAAVMSRGFVQYVLSASPGPRHNALVACKVMAGDRGWRKERYPFRTQGAIHT